MDDDAVAEASPERHLVCAGHHTAAIVVFCGVAVVVLIADQVLKYGAFFFVAGVPVVLDPARPQDPSIPEHLPVVVIPGVLSLKLTTNTGAVFGLFAGGRWVFIVVSIVATTVIGRIFWRTDARATALHMALAMMLAGALGNLYDRIMYSAVRDMLWLFPGIRVWPWIFNLADAALMVGVGGVLLLTCWRPRPGGGSALG